jgi:hypothetical protein
MKKLLILFICLLITLSSALSLTIEEKISTSTVAPGGTVLVTYTPKEYAGKIIWLVGRTVPTGWTIKAANGLILNEGRYGYLGFDITPMTVVLTAPNNPGTYTFIAGEWGVVEQLANNQTKQAEADYQNFIITVTGNPTTCISSWSCGAWSNVTGACGTRTCTDANACTTPTANPNPLTKTCGTEEKKDICENLPKLTGDCTVDGIILAFGALMLLAMFSRMMRK